MAKERVVHVCGGCGFASPKWFGKCPDCGEWSTASEATTSGKARAASLLGGVVADPPRNSTGLDEVDRVLGGGAVGGSCILLAGEPGIGKSTLVLQLLDGLVRGGHDVLLATGEESLGQVAARGRRLGVDVSGVRALSTSSLEAVQKEMRASTPAAVVVDSIQTIATADHEQGCGSVVQVRECAVRLTRDAKESGAVVILVGHVTKDGAVAGPKTLEHVVDVVLTLEGERTGGMRLLRASKNRFGSCDETGVFTMTERGLEAVDDPSSLMLADRRPGVPGSCVFPGLEGTRPIVAEVQALVAPATSAHPRRVPVGIDLRRLTLITAVLSARAGIDLTSDDTFVAVSGGMRIDEPAADLAIALAIVSSKRGRALPESVVVAGELGLGGEIRRVPGCERRLAEAARLGFDTAIVPQGLEGAPHGIRPVVARDISGAVESLVPLLEAVGEAG